MNTLFKWLIPIVSAAAVSTAVYFGITSGSGAVETAPAATSPSSGSTVSDAPAKPVVKKEITEWDSLDVSDANTYPTDTVGKKYSYYLIDVLKNEDLWNQQHEVYKADINKENWFDATFNSGQINGAFEPDKNDDSVSYLNKACKSIYKEKTTGNKWTDDEQGKKLKQNVWKYCSLIEKEPKLIKDTSNDDGYVEGKIGKAGKDYLVSVNDGSNDKFWKLKNKWFKALKPQPTEADFQNKDNVKEACKAAYDKQSNGQPTLDIVKKYCSFVETNQPQQ